MIIVTSLNFLEETIEAQTVNPLLKNKRRKPAKILSIDEFTNSFVIKIKPTLPWLTKTLIIKLFALGKSTL